MGTNQHCFRHLPGTKGVVGKEVQLDLGKIKDYFKQEMAEAAAPDDVNRSHFSMVLTDHQTQLEELCILMYVKSLNHHNPKETQYNNYHHLQRSRGTERLRTCPRSHS